MIFNAASFEAAFRSPCLSNPDPAHAAKQSSSWCDQRVRPTNDSIASKACSLSTQQISPALSTCLHAQAASMQRKGRNSSLWLIGHFIFFLGFDQIKGNSDLGIDIAEK
jgi:hypothetical protein